VEQYKIIVQQSESTVVEKYEFKNRGASDYQSEAQLERELIQQLKNQGYEFVTLHSNDAIVDNFRLQMERLNQHTFTSKEWNVFWEQYVNNPNDGIVEKTKKIQEDYVFNLKLDNGTSKNIRLLDKTNIHNNILQVVHQVEVEGSYKNIYDVSILVNGLPLVHIELKRRGVSIKEAFNQINRYQRESFWVDSGLYEYVQLFVISNGTETKYYSNTTRDRVAKEQSSPQSNTKKTSHSFEFTSYWADANNKNILELMDFAATFLSRHTLLNVLTKYCVFTSDQSLLVMRPYQIAATERIINRVYIANNTKAYGSIEAGGYVWHTTGSGKTLTSFKTAMLISGIPFVDKVLFVVDRKDLDYQTMKEYDKFQKGAANSNTSTSVLKKQLEDNDPNKKVIITTIQKLSIFIKKNPGHPLFQQHTVMIFDECHRSQFGEMHQDIIKSFKKYYIYGFTGTPIFAANTTTHNKFPTLKTTEQVFGRKLHTYTIVNAIHDGNVLPFRIHYHATTKLTDAIDETEQVYDIDRERALLDPRRIKLIVKYILEHFGQKTKRNERAYDLQRILNVAEVARSSYGLRQEREQRAVTKITGFNSMMAVASIEAAKRYYEEFRQQQAHLPETQRLKIATIFSWSANEELDGLSEENNENTDRLDQSSRDFLADAIQDYNKYFGTSYDTSSDKFQNYYKDLSLRVKNREIDLLLVVNMFLTGFDATTLNTIWVDKKLKMHGLIQAFSRTNRILNSIKTYGNVVCFRNLEEQVKQAISIFGDKEAGGIVLLKTFDQYYFGYDDFKGYQSLVHELQERYPLGQELISEKDQKGFVRLFNEILRTWNILQSFDEFKTKELFTNGDLQDYKSLYNRIYEDFKRVEKADAESIQEQIEFEIELIKSVEVNIDYILMLVDQMHDTLSEDKETDIKRAIDSSPSLRNKKDLILNFIATLNADKNVINEWTTYLVQQKEQELQKIIDEEGLQAEPTIRFVDEAFKSGQIRESGTSIAQILPPVSMFGKQNGLSRGELKQRVVQRLLEFFERFFGI
jgi:type I restriction enzyme, R subunit